MDLVEQKLKQHLEDEKVQLERLTSTLEENRERHKQELYKFNLERTNLVEELQRVEELRRYDLVAFYFILFIFAIFIYLPLLSGISNGEQGFRGEGPGRHATKRAVART